MERLSPRVPVLTPRPEPVVRTSLVLAPPLPPVRLVPARPAGGVWAAASAVVDFVVAAGLLVALAPLIEAAWAAVRLTSRGPGVYTQRRVGRGGRVFTIYKLRTMYHECESLTGPRWSIPGDPRITPLGRVLRDLHVDELPQLWNVLRGDMALVGPRPERPEIVRQLREVLPGYDRRHTVRPGITGFAQIHLPPDTCVRSVRAKLAYDRFWVANRTLRLDAVVIGCTALKLFGLRRLYRRPAKGVRPA